MILRSGRLIGLDNPTIDFNISSKKWIKNKIKLGNGLYRYKSTRSV